MICLAVAQFDEMNEEEKNWLWESRIDRAVWACFFFFFFVAGCPSMSIKCVYLNPLRHLRHPWYASAGVHGGSTASTCFHMLPHASTNLKVQRSHIHRTQILVAFGPTGTLSWTTCSAHVRPERWFGEALCQMSLGFSCKTLERSAGCHADCPLDCPFPFQYIFFMVEIWIVHVCPNSCRASLRVSPNGCHMYEGDLHWRSWDLLTFLMETW